MRVRLPTLVSMGTRWEQYAFLSVPEGALRGISVPEVVDNALCKLNGMEEVVGSIPTRSTNHLNNLDRPNVQRQSVCVMVCIIPRHFAAIGEGFHCCTLCFHTDVTVPFQHLAADVSGNRHDG